MLDVVLDVVLEVGGDPLTYRQSVGATHNYECSVVVLDVGGPVGPLHSNHARARSVKDGDMGKRERDKGKRGELLFRDLLRSYGWDGAKRGQQRAGVDQPDVVGGPAGVHFEVKFVEKLNVGAAFDQAERDAGAQMPVVAHKKSSKPWLVTLGAKEFLALLRSTDL